MKPVCFNCEYFEEGYCSHYDMECERITQQDNPQLGGCEMFKPREKDDPVCGDNCPACVREYYVIMKEERIDIIKKLLIGGMTRITKNDICDMKIDLEIYNKSCRKEKIKKIYKRKKKEKK